MKTQVQTLLFWVGAVLVVVAATIFYQPAAAKTGSLLVWTENRVYVMDIDSLTLRRVAGADPNERITPSPGCFGHTETPCWVVIGSRLYEVSPYSNSPARAKSLPGAGPRWIDSAVSWSPDGLHLAYSIRSETTTAAELRLIHAGATEAKIVAVNVDPELAIAWTPACKQGLDTPACRIGFKTAEKEPSRLIALAPATGKQRSWEIAAERVFALRWTADDELLYSQPQRHFYDVETHRPAYQTPPGGQLANISPTGGYTIYYQPFTLRGCSEADQERCLHVGVWIAKNGDEEADPGLIYNLNLAESRRTGGLNFIPIWTVDEKRAVFFQDGQLIHYDVQAQEATIWYKQARGKLRSEPIFSPYEEAVAFVDNQGQGYSEYRLVIVNPRLQPVEHIIETKSGFRLLAWLPW